MFGWRVSIIVGGWLALGGAAAAQAPAWTFAGPAGLTGSVIGGQPLAGPVAAIATPGPGSGVIYIAGLGGVWEHSTSGWAPLTDTQTTTWVSALALSGNTLYAGTGDVNGFHGGAHAGIGILASPDGGASWSVLGAQPFAGLAITRIGVDPGNAQHLLVAAIAAPNSPAGAIAGLYSSTNGGTSWQLEVTGNVWDFAWNGSAGEIVAAGNGALWRSADNGATFAEVAAAALPAAWGRAAICTLAGGGFAALFSDSTGAVATLAASADGGLTWQAKAAPANLFYGDVGLRAIAVASDPRDATHLWVGGADLWESRTAGTQWTDLTNGGAAGVAPGVHAIVPPGDGSLDLGTDGGLWYAAPAAVGAATAALENSNAGLQNAAVLALAPAPGTGGGNDAVVAGLVGDGVAVGNGGGAGWLSPAPATTAPGSGDIASVAIDPVTPKYTYAARAGAADLWISNNGGAAWSSLAAQIGAAASPLQDAATAPAVVPLAVDPGGSGTLYCGTTQLWKSVNQGATWTALAGSSMPGGISAIALTPQNGLLIWLASASGGLLRSSDGGATWTAETPPVAGGAISDLEINGSTGQLWLAYSSVPGNGADVWSSATAGASWLSAGALAGGVSRLALDPVRPNVVAAATAQFAPPVNVTLNGGSNWSALENGLPGAPVGDLAFDNSETLWAATQGRGIWSAGLAQAAISVSAPAAPNAPQPTSVSVGGTVTLQALVSSLGAPLAGVPVAWSADVGNWTGSSLSGANGIASISYTAADTAGSIAILAVAGGANSTAEMTYNLAITPLAPARLLVVAGAQQAQTAGTQLTAPIVISALDNFSNPVPNVAVTLSDGGAGGSFASGTLTTGSNGQVSASYTLPPTPANVSLTATAAGALGPVTAGWSETGLPAPDFSLALGTPVGTLAPNTTATIPLQIIAIGNYDSAVSLVCLAPVPGCSVLPASALPGTTATVTLSTGALDPNTPTTTVSVQGTDAAHGLQHGVSTTLQLPGFTFAPAISTLAMDASTTASPAIPITVAPFNGFTGTIAFTATLSDGTPLPSGVTITYSPNPLVIAANAIDPTTQLSILAPPAVLSRLGPHSVRRGPRPGPPAGPGAAWWLGLLAALGLLGTRLHPGSSKRLGAAGVLGLAALSLGCGGGAAAADVTTTVTLNSYALILTATSTSGLQSTASFSLTVSDDSAIQ